MNIVPVEFSAEYRVYYEDTDAAGVVYHANYLKFMERARTDWLAGIGYLPNQYASNFGVIFAVRSAVVEFKKPAYLGDTLKVSIDYARLSGASFKVQQQITCNQKLLVSSTFRIACLDSNNLKVRRIPAELIKKFSP